MIGAAVAKVRAVLGRGRRRRRAEALAAATHVERARTGEVLNVERQTLKRFYVEVGAVTGRQKRRARKALRRAQREEAQ